MAEENRPNTANRPTPGVGVRHDRPTPNPAHGAGSYGQTAAGGTINRTAAAPSGTTRTYAATQNRQKQEPEPAPEQKPAVDYRKADSEMLLRDPAFVRAVKYCIDTGSVSIRGIAKGLSIGFFQAARLVDAMEHYGYITSVVNIDEQQLNELEDN